MKIAFFASSLVSAYWNGAATYYRGIVRALSMRGHNIDFYEPDAFDRQRHRDIEDPPWARVVVYPATHEGVHGAIEQARGADLVVKASGVGVFDSLLEEAVASMRGPETLAVFWDVDAPATLARVQDDPSDPFRNLIPCYDMIFTYGGGPPVVRAYEELGARRCVPIYNGVDASTHYAVASDPRFEGVLGFLGNRLPDREQRVEEFFLSAAERLPQERFVLGGSGWESKPMAPNVAYVGHVYTRDHNAFNVTPRAVLNISRESMAKTGYSPATRVFEAAGAGACLITDAWEGIEQFLTPDAEVLVARSGEEVAEHLDKLSSVHARVIGERARARVLREHTYDQRARDVERALDACPQPVSRRSTGQQLGSGNGNGNGNGNGARRLRVVVLGLTVTSSWGNGHATTYRGLLQELGARGHDVLFLERDMPWYAQNRDLGRLPHAQLALYRDLSDLKARFAGAVRDADLVVVGSYVPEGTEVGDWVTRTARGATAFYDIDTPVTLAKLAAGDYEYLTPQLIPRFDMYLSFTGGPTLVRLEQELGAVRALPLYCSVDPAHYGPAAGEAPRWLLSYMGTYSEDRQPPLERLLLEVARLARGEAFAVAGSQYPDHIVWPKNVERIMHLPPAEHRRFYGRSAFTLNITRRDMIAAGFAPSVRLFEAAACGVAIISDIWDGIDEFLEPGREILLARSTADVLHILRETTPSERAEIGERARERVMRSHTAAHRALELESYVLGTPSAPPAGRA